MKFRYGILQEIISWKENCAKNYKKNEFFWRRSYKDFFRWLTYNLRNILQDQEVPKKFQKSENLNNLILT